MNQSLLEILLIFFSEQPSSENMRQICRKVPCYLVWCHDCVLGRKCSVDTNMSKVHERLNQIETTLKVIINEPTTDSNNK